jgi:hypothetical protein
VLKIGFSGFFKKTPKSNKVCQVRSEKNNVIRIFHGVISVANDNKAVEVGFYARRT